jgi:UDP-N-acetylmuramate--alanine ligase
MHYHFSGIAGAGMNPLAQLMLAWGHTVQGSDRGFDQGRTPDVAQRLAAAGIVILPQDGTAVTPAVERFVYSAAVEADTPEMRAAKAGGIACLARPGLLAEVINTAAPGIAISGTSGKSTVTGMLAWILRQTQTPATILGGAALAGEGVAGCFAVGPRGGIVAAEACESDGTLVGYRAGIGLIHNITRDHGELAGLRAQFATFAAQSKLLLVNAGCPEALAAAAASQGRVRSYGLGGAADYPLEIISLGPSTSTAVLGLPQGDLTISLLHPGAHNLENAAAAAVIAIELGLAPTAIAAALATFPGVARRFEVVGITDTGIRVVDDYAHNADKIRAAVQAAQAGADRVVAIFQPHGFGPARFLRSELKVLLPTLLRPNDRWCYTNIFYAGGSVAQDIHSRDLAADLPAELMAMHADDRQQLLTWLCEQAGAGDTVLLMGARDPDLPALARAIHDVL